MSLNDISGALIGVMGGTPEKSIHEQVLDHLIKTGGGAILSASRVSSNELNAAKLNGRYYEVDGYGFVIRSAEWVSNAELAEITIKDLKKRIPPERRRKYP